MGKTILCVEDNPNNRLLVRRMLEAEGYHVLEADCGEEGITVAARTLPDLILMDITLPDINGYEATRRLRENPALARTPILAVTANVMKGDREKALSAGCNSYISKPIDVDQLPRLLAEYL